jgi:signal transduction histidine kinase
MNLVIFGLETTTAVKTVGAVLVVFGVLLAVFTYFYWKSARPEPEALAPLEVMSAKRFATTDPLDQQRLLDEVRPEGMVAPKETVRMAMQAVVMATQAEKIEAARLASERAERERLLAENSEELLAQDADLPTRANAPIDPLLG